MLLLLLLSHFSCVRLCVTLETAAHQAPPSLGFSRQEHWIWLNNLSTVIITRYNYKYFFPIMSFNGFDSSYTASLRLSYEGVGCHFLFQGIFPTQELNRGVLYWQADSLPTELPRKPTGRGNIKIPIRKVSYILHFRVDRRR